MRLLVGKKRIFALPFLCVALSVTFPASRAHADESMKVEEFEVHVGDAFLKAFDFPAGTVAKASNGDTIEVIFTGEINPGEGAKGFGSFAHRSAPTTANPKGTLVGFGTFEAKKVVSFTDFGAQSNLPPTFHGGSASILVEVKGHAASDPAATVESDAVLMVDCKVGNFPAGFKEGITFAITGGLDFNEKVSGATVFVAEEPGEAEAEVEGAIESIAPPTLTVAGRTVVTDANTRIEGNDQLLTLADLKVGQTVEVKGTLLSDGTVLARKIEVKGALRRPQRSRRLS